MSLEKLLHIAIMLNDSVMQLRTAENNLIAEKTLIPDDLFLDEKNNRVVITVQLRPLKLGFFEYPFTIELHKENKKVLSTIMEREEPGLMITAYKDYLCLENIIIELKEGVEIKEK